MRKRFEKIRTSITQMSFEDAKKIITERQLARKTAYAESLKRKKPKVTQDIIDLSEFSNPKTMNEMAKANKLLGGMTPKQLEEFKRQIGIK